MKNKILIITIGFLLLIIGVLIGTLLSTHKQLGSLVREHASLKSHHTLPPTGGYVGPWGSDPFFAQDRDSWDPFQEMEEMRGIMNRMFRDSFARGIHSGGFSGHALSYNPDIEVRDTGKEYLVRIDLPGIDKDKINVKVQNNLLIISGERTAESEQSEDEGQVYRAERSFGSFMRTMPLPTDADTERMTAESAKGVLTVRIPKLPGAKTDTKKVEVR